MSKSTLSSDNYKNILKVYNALGDSKLLEYNKNMSHMTRFVSALSMLELTELSPKNMLRQHCKGSTNMGSSWNHALNTKSHTTNNLGFFPNVQMTNGIEIVVSLIDKLKNLCC